MSQISSETSKGKEREPKKTYVISTLKSIALNGFVTFAVAILWFKPFLTCLKPDTTEIFSLPMAAGALLPTILLVGISIALGGILRYLFGRTKSALAMITAALLGPVLAGWAAATSGDLRNALMGLPGDGGLLSLAYFGAWLVTFTYLMKLPWDRSTEIIRDNIKARFEPAKSSENCKCQMPEKVEVVPIVTPPAEA